MHSSLHVFNPTSFDVSIDEVITPEVLPVSGVKDDAAIEFILPAESNHYLDLASLRLYIQIKVSTTADKDIPADKTIALVPLWSSALFKEVAISVGQKVVSTSTNIYPIRAYMETCLSFSEAAKKEMLTALEHFSETPLVKGHGVLEAFSPLHVDICQQPKMLINGLEVRIRLLRNEDAFVLLKKDTKDAENYKIEVKKLSLFVRKVRPSSSILLTHAKTLAKQNAIYPIQRVWMKQYTIQKGIKSQVLQNVFMGALPKKIILGMLKAVAFNGDVKENPFVFKHFDVNELSLDIDGRQVPTVSFTPDFTQKHVRREYYCLLESILGACIDRDTIGITLDEYVEGKTFFAFPLSDFFGSGIVFSAKQQGNINIRLRFAKELPENITVVLYGEFENQIEIDSARNVYTDYSI